MTITRTSTAEHFAEISDFTSRQRGGNHTQHLLRTGNHADSSSQTCDWCAAERNQQQQSQSTEDTNV
jgi:hypothetical protein